MIERIVDIGDQVTVEHPMATGAMTKETFLIVSANGDPKRKPVPHYDKNHPWARIVLGKTVGSKVTLPTAEENVTEALILEAIIPEPATE